MLALFLFASIASAQEPPRTFGVPFHSVNSMVLLDATVNDKPPVKVEAPKPKPETARVANKKFWGVIAVLGAAKTADGLTTERALSRGCLEGNTLLFSRHPSDSRLALGNAAYFAGEVAIAYSLKRFGRKHRWAKPLWLIEPAFQTAQHIDFSAHNEGSACR